MQNTKTKTAKVVKDTTKRDVVVLQSASNKVAFITTNLLFSGVTQQRAQELLVKDMTTRANNNAARAQKFASLLSAADLEVVQMLVQVDEHSAQIKKFEVHNNFVAQGFTMLSTRGSGEQVRAAIAAQQAQQVVENA